RFRAAGDEIHHRAFARAIGADDGAQLANVHVEIQVRDGLEAVERLVHVFQRKYEFLRHGYVFSFTSTSGSRTGNATGTASTFAREAHRRRSAPICSGMPTKPFGKKSVITMNKPPKMYSQY